MKDLDFTAHASLPSTFVVISFILRTLLFLKTLVNAKYDH